ncbi:MAG: pseudouridine synthase [Bacteroidota bacterium]|nr:pseudouridine synthase [Bacteroidota bacterium]
MKLLKLITCCSAVLALSLNSADAQKPATPEKVTTVEGITEYKLANGLRVLLFPDPSKATMTVNITYLVGSRMEGYGETGMAHLLEHMVFKGSTKHTNIPQELTSHGASPNGSTDFDRTNYFESFNATDENLKWALDMESDRMVNSFIAQKDLETEFSVVRNEFEAGENYPEGVLYERVMSTAYLWHNYGKATIGSKEDIEKVPANNLKVFYKKYYQPDNAVLTVAGKIDEAKVLELVNQYFGSIPKPSRKIEEPYTMEPTQDGERSVELRRVGDVQVVSCGYHIPSGISPDYAAVEVLVEALTNEPSGRLYKALVEAKKASNQYGYALELKDPGFVYFSASVLKDKSLKDAHNAMMNVLDSMAANPITAEELERAKNAIIKEQDLLLNNSANLGLTLSEFIALGDWRMFFITRDRVEKITLEDVNRVAQAYFKPSNRTVGYFYPEAKPVRAEIPANPDLASIVKDYKGRKALADAEKFDPSPTNIEARTKKGKLDGGAQYAFLSKSTRGNSVNVNITLRVGTEKSLENKSVIPQLTADMLRKGTKNKTEQQINDAFDKLKAEVSINGSGQQVTIHVTTIKENLNNTLKLLTEILREPTFPSSEFDKLKDEELANIEQQRSDPQALAFNTFNRVSSSYPKGHFKYTMSYDDQAEAIKGIKVQDVKQFYTDYYNSVSATVAVIGDFDEATTLGELKPMLANWKSTQAYEHAPDTYFDIAAKTERILTPDKKNATFVAGQNLKLQDNDPDYAALVMGNFMLGGGFLNSRLATRIREKEGLSYGVGSWLYGGQLEQSGGFGSYAIYNPDNAEKLVASYKDEIAKVLKDGYTEAELKDAKSGYLQSKEVGRSQDNQLVYKLANNLFLNRTMQWDEALDKKVEGLTVAQINAAMKKFIQPDKLTYVQAGDFKSK